MTMLLMAFSCSKKKTIGNPYILFEIHGTVYGDRKIPNEQTPQPDDSVVVELPIEGIRVSCGTSEPVYTGPNGKFVLYGRSNPGDSVTLLFKDEDLEVNGGPYQKLNLPVQLRQRDAGDGGNYMGYWFASGIKAKLIQKEETINPDPSPLD